MARRIAFLIYRAFQLLDASGPLVAFEIAERYNPGFYNWKLITRSTGGAVASEPGPKQGC